MVIYRSATEGEKRGERHAPGWRTFLTVWAGQAVSLLGTAMNGFALGVWTYERTGSVTQFSLILFFSALPGVLMLPFAGPLIDRWDRRSALLLGSCGGAVASLVMALLFQAARLELWHIYLLVAASAATQSFRWPALSASITLLVPPPEMTRANGLLQLGMSLSQVLAPVAAGALLAPIGLGGILWLNVASYAAALATLLAVRIPRPPAPAVSRGAAPLLAQFADGWRYLTARRGLLELLVLFAACNFTVGLVTALLTPLVLGFADARVLGTVLSVASCGLIAGGLLTSVWRGTRRLIHAILVPMLLQGLVLLVGGVRPNAALLAAAACLFLAATPIISASSQAIWQSKVAPEIQGRVFALRQMIALSALPLSRLAAGPLADHVFEPLLASGGPLAGALGRVFGVGSGRGIALLFTVLGVVYLAVLAAAWSSPRLRRVEEEIPSVVPEPAAPAGVAAAVR
jgi:MFS family permease